MSMKEALPADGGPYLTIEVTAKLGSWGGYFFFAIWRTRPMMPMTTRQN